MKLKKSVNKFYRKVKLIIYKNMFNRIKDKGESLSSSEYFCLECIYLMGEPTVSQFANFMDISSPNATYKVKQLTKKGFITKEKSQKDGREYILRPTQKFYDFYENKEDYVLINDLKQNMNKKECKKIDKIMKILMDQKHEIRVFLYRQNQFFDLLSKIFCKLAVWIFHHNSDFFFCPTCTYQNSTRWCSFAYYFCY